MKIWLDDQIDDPGTPDRHPPSGWVGIDTALKACRLIKSGIVTDISFDHDLGPTWASTGYVVAKFIEKLAFEKAIPPIKWEVHSANSVGSQNIRRAMKSADRFWRL